MPSNDDANPPVRRIAPAVALSLCLSACTTTVFAPARIEDPAGVGVLDHGRHSSLILEASDGGMLRYAYGDWGWYALDETGIVEGSAAVLWPTPAGLGRMRLPGPFSPAAVSRRVRVPIEHAVYITVEAREVRRLVQRLDRIVDENNETLTYNKSYDLMFVRHPESYWILNNSNLMVRHWLEELGCSVKGPGIFAIWARGTASP